MSWTKNPTLFPIIRLPNILDEQPFIREDMVFCLTIGQFDSINLLVTEIIYTNINRKVHEHYVSFIAL